MTQLNGKVALVTGGGRGIGRAVALALAQEGCDIAVLARTSEQVAAEIRVLGRRSYAVACDVAHRDMVHRALEEVHQALGALDILINDAAVVEPMGSTVEIDPDEWAYAQAINLIGAFHYIQACLPTMLESGWGRIVNISSEAATGSGLHRGNAYSVSKAALEMLTANLAAELADSGVTVNAVRPGTVDTKMNAHVRGLPVERIGQQVHEQFNRMHQQGLLLDPARPAQLLVNLVKGESTGEIISIYDQRSQELLAK